MELVKEERDLVLRALYQYGAFVRTIQGEEQASVKYFELHDKIVDQDGKE